MPATHERVGTCWGVFVKPEWRRKGVATQLMRSICDHWRSIGCQRGVLLCASDEARRVYARLGFGAAEVEACLGQMRADAALPDCLDWCSLHLADHLLPPAFRVTGSGDDALPAAQPQLDKPKVASDEKALAAAEAAR